MRVCERNNCTDTKVSEEAGGAAAPGTGAEIPLQPMEKTMEADGAADLHPQPMENPKPEQVNAPEGGCDPSGSPRWSRLLAGPADLWKEEPMPRAGLHGLVTLWRTPRWSSLFLRGCTLWKGPMLEHVMKNYSSWKGPILEKFVEDCLPWVRPHAEEGEKSKEEGAAEMMCDELSGTPIPSPLCRWVGGGREKSGVKSSPGRREG